VSDELRPAPYGEPATVRLAGASADDCKVIVEFLREDPMSRSVREKPGRATAIRWALAFAAEHVRKLRAGAAGG
jgi:hypothetical protein